MTTVERALTLHSPWPEAIIDHGKHVENRSWPIPSTIELPCWIAIHEGQAFDAEGAAYIKAMTRETLTASTPGHIVALVQLQACLTPEEVERSRTWADQDLWAAGPYCWCFDEVIELIEPIPARGAHRLWRIKPETQQEIARQLELIERRVKNARETERLNAHIKAELDL